MFLIPTSVSRVQGARWESRTSEGHRQIAGKTEPGRGVWKRNAKLEAISNCSRGAGATWDAGRERAGRLPLRSAAVSAGRADRGTWGPSSWPCPWPLQAHKGIKACLNITSTLSNRQGENQKGLSMAAPRTENSRVIGKRVGPGKQDSKAAQQAAARSRRRQWPAAACSQPRRRRGQPRRRRGQPLRVARWRARASRAGLCIQCIGLDRRCGGRRRPEDGPSK